MADRLDTTKPQRITIELPSVVLNQLETIATQYSLTRDDVVRELIRFHPFEIPAGGRSRAGVQTSLILSGMYRAKAANSATSP